MIRGYPSVPGQPMHGKPNSAGTSTSALRQVAVMLLAILAIMAVLSIGWEFYIEEPLSRLLRLPFDEGLEAAVRWRFILRSLVFAGMALVGPVLLLVRAFLRLDRTQNSLIRAQDEAEAFARHDTLTGLSNRRVFTERLREAFANRDGPGNGCAVLLIDLDWFKAVNDVHGHLTGDAVLVEVANVLRKITPAGATIARLGGDEFGILPAGAMGADQLGLLARRIVAAIADLREMEGASITVGATIGIAVAGPQERGGPRGLMRAADAALHRAKQARGSIQFFEAGMGEELRRNAELREALRQAIVSGEGFAAHYQPVIELGQGRLVGFEVLARWHDSRHGDVPPATFIPIAEEAGLIGDLTRLVLRQAAQCARLWPAELAIAVNVSPRQLQDTTLPRQILDILRETGLAPVRLEIEITENALAENIEAAKQILSELHAAGIRIALDDFGTGYSSLYHLRELPFTKLKIDRSFVQSLHLDDANRRLLQGILGLARSLGIETTAEGIEHKSDADWLRAHGCSFGQGYLYGRPMAADDVLAFLRDLGRTARPAGA